MVSRTVTNSGAPLFHPDGTPAANVKVSFTMVDQQGAPHDAFDLTTGECIASGPVSAYTDSTGVFTIALWPTTRAAGKVLYYLCHVDLDTWDDFMAYLPEGGSALSWSTFMANGGSFSVGQFNTPNMIVNQNGGSPTLTSTLVDTSGGDVTTSLPVSGEVVIIKSDASANRVIIQPSVGGQTVCGGASISLDTQFEYVRLLLSGTNWYKIGG
jgi:hypothetical protein